MHNRSVSAATDINFPPNDLTLNLMPAFLSLKKVRRGRGASSSSPYHAYANAHAETPGGARTNPMGKRLYVSFRYTLQAARRGGICLLTSTPPSIPGSFIITYQ